MMNNTETVRTTAQRVYDKAFCDFLEQGFSPSEAEEKADLFLLEWSQPIDLPDAPAEAWDCAEDEL